MRFLDKMVNVYRNVVTIGLYNRPNHTLQLIGQYKAGVSKKIVGVNNLVPQDLAQKTIMIYFEPDANIKVNDIVEVDGERYIIQVPFFYQTHIEVEGKYYKEV